MLTSIIVDNYMHLLGKDIKRGYFLSLPPNFYEKWLVKGKGIPYPEIINKSKRKLIKNKIKGYINGSY